MSVKYALMALLAHAEKPASALQAEYLAAMEHTQTLNIGQVSQTLSRLERSGLIATAGETTGSAGHHVTVYSLTEEGHKALHTWWIEPTLRGVADRDELLTKITLAATDPTVNLLEILDRQRTVILAELRSLNKASRHLPHARTAERLKTERRIFDLEAEARWLDRVEALDPTSPADTTGEKTP